MINLEEVKTNLLSDNYTSDKSVWLKKILETYNSKDLILAVDWLNDLDFKNEVRHSIELYADNHSGILDLIHTFYITENVINSTNFITYLKNLEIEAKSEIEQWKFEKKVGY